MKKLVLLGALALAPILAQAQYSNYPNVIPFPGVPSGACAQSQLAVNTSNGNLYSCSSASWTAVGTSLPALTDNGTNVISTEPIVVPAFANSTATMALGVTGSVTNGFGIDTSGSGARLWMVAGGVRRGPLLDGNTGNIVIGSSGSYSFVASATDPGTAGADTILRRRSAANFGLGTVDVNGVPVAQTISVQNAITGTDLPGAAAFTLAAPLGTGAGAGTSTQFQRALMGATGTTAQTGVAAFVVCESKTLSNTSATAQTLANIALASNSGGGARGSITVVATDGTNFDSETQDFVVSYVNKATVGTVGTAAITASTAANNSGSATIGMTATFSGTTLSIKATPVFTTIVPTTVTSYLELQNHGAGAVTCQ